MKIIGMTGAISYGFDFAFNKRAGVSRPKKTVCHANLSLPVANYTAN